MCRAANLEPVMLDRSLLMKAGPGEPMPASRRKAECRDALSALWRAGASVAGGRRGVWAAQGMACAPKFPVSECIGEMNTFAAMARSDVPKPYLRRTKERGRGDVG